MFERYTEKARRVIFFARYEASQFGSPDIESEFLLLAMFREDNHRVTRWLGGDWHTILRQEIEQRVMEGQRPLHPSIYRFRMNPNACLPTLLRNPIASGTSTSVPSIFSSGCFATATHARRDCFWIAA